MKKQFTLLLTTLLISTDMSFAQTASDNSQNKPNASNTGYLMEFKGATADNCPNQIPYDQYFIPSTYTVNSQGNDTLSISTNGNQEGWHKINIRLYSGNCTGTTVNLANNQNLVINVKSSVAVPQFMVMLADVNGNYANNNPPVKALTVGNNTLSVSDLDFSIYGSSNKIDSTQIAIIALHFRIAYNDNDGAGGPTPSVIGTYKISQIKMGDVSGILGVQDQKVASTLEVYPNPSTDNLNVSFESNKEAEVSILDLSGKVLRKSVKDAGANSIIFNTEDLSSGLYVLSIVTEDGVATRKFSVNGK